MRALLTASLVALSLAGCERAGDEGEAHPTASVTTAIAHLGVVDDTLTAYGAAEFAPEGEHVLSAPVEASVARILAPAGTRVAAGQAVVALAPSPASGQDAIRASAEAAAADATLARARRLRAAGLDSDADVEAAQAAARVADAALKSLKARSGPALTLTAPAAGVVEAVAFEPGAVAAQGAVVARIGALADLQVRLGLESGATARVRPGARVHLIPLAGGPPREAVVESVEARLDPQTRQSLVRVRAPAGALTAGEGVKGEIVLGRRAGVILVPRAAVVYDGDQPAVFIVRAGAARRRTVVLGAESGAGVEIAKGVALGERVVVEGASALEEGMAVREVAPAAAPTGEAS